MDGSEVDRLISQLENTPYVTSSLKGRVIDMIRALSEAEFENRIKLALAKDELKAKVDELRMENQFLRDELAECDSEIEFLQSVCRDF